MKLFKYSEFHIKLIDLIAATNSVSIFLEESSNNGKTFFTLIFSSSNKNKDDSNISSRVAHLNYKGKKSLNFFEQDSELYIFINLPLP